MVIISSNRNARYISAGRTLAQARYRNRPTSRGGCGCPIIIEGRKDRIALQSMSFIGPIEQVNRGWDQSKFVTYIYEKYGLINKVDQGPSVILLMDWDRTGGRLQRTLGDRMKSFGMRVDEQIRMGLIRAMKPEGKTIESLGAHSEKLTSYIDEFDPTDFEEE